MKHKQYTHARTCVFNINYHIVWCTKYRKKVLSDDVAKRLKELLFEIGNAKGFTVVKAEIGDNDHVHCFVSAPPKLSVTNIARWLKGISGRHIMIEHPEIRGKLWKGHLWNGSYFAETIGSTSEENILRYIERQRSVQR